jgi:hypothetical protein
VRISVSHERPVEQVKQSVDRSFDDLFKSIAGTPVQLLNEQRTWQGDTMSFSLTAKVGFMNAPIKGSIEVTDHEVIINADLGILERLLPTEKLTENVTTRVKGLLNRG